MLVKRAINRLRDKITPFHMLEDSEAEVPAEQAIPPVVNQTGSSRRTDARHRRGIERFRDFNRDLSFVFFDDDGMLHYMQSRWSHHPIFRVFELSRFPQMKSDIFRYCLIFERGGYYCDINKAVFSQLSSLTGPTDTGLITSELNECVLFPSGLARKTTSLPQKLVAQWAFGFAPRHDLLGLVIEGVVSVAAELGDSTVRNVREAVLMTTGPGVFTRAFRQWLELGNPTGLVQAGIDFYGTGVFRLPGSEHRPEKTRPYYATQHDQPIFARRIVFE